MRIVKERSTGKIMAMKKLRKSEMLRRGQVEHVKAERNVLAEVHSPYVVKLFYSFQVGEGGISKSWGAGSVREGRGIAHWAMLL